MDSFEEYKKSLQAISSLTRTLVDYPQLIEQSRSLPDLNGIISKPIESVIDDIIQKGAPQLTKKQVTIPASTKLSFSKSIDSSKMENLLDVLQKIICYSKEKLEAARKEEKFLAIVKGSLVRRRLRIRCSSHPIIRKHCCELFRDIYESEKQYQSALKHILDYFVTPLKRYYNIYCFLFSRNNEFCIFLCASVLFVCYFIIDTIQIFIFFLCVCVC